MDGARSRVSTGNPIMTERRDRGEKWARPTMHTSQAKTTSAVLTNGMACEAGDGLASGFWILISIIALALSLATALGGR